MKKIVEFLKSRYKVLIPLMVVLVLLVTVYFFYREYKYDNYRNKVEVPVFQYFNSVRVDYQAQVVYNLRDVIVDINATDRKMNYDSTPVYYKVSDSVLFPSEMNVVFPLKDGVQYKAYKYASYKYEDEKHYLDNNSNNFKKYDNFFMFDGKYLFFFPDEVTIKIGDKEYTKLGRMSSVKLIGGATLEYYDSENDKVEFIEVEGKKIVAVNDNMSVNLTDQYLSIYNNKILLFSPQTLNSLTNWQKLLINDIIIFRIEIV